MTSDGDATPIGLAQILHAVERIARDPKTTRLLSASRPPRHRPDPFQGKGVVLSQAWRPCRASPMHDRRPPRAPGAASEDAHSDARERSATFRGFLPLQRFSSRGERPCSRPALVPPNVGSGCVLRVSHSLDALLPPRPVGLVSSRSRSWGSTLRGLPRCGAVRTSRSAVTLRGFLPDRTIGAALPGFGTPHRVSGPGPVIHQRSGPCDLHGLFPCEASCSPLLRATPPGRPLSRFADRHPAPRERGWGDDRWRPRVLQ